jgi:hypothetical protein
MFFHLVVAWVLSMAAAQPCETTEQCEQQIRPYIEFVFEDHPYTTPEEAVQVAWCESRFLPTARNGHSSAGGVFQYLWGTWEWESFYWGFPRDPNNRFDPVLAIDLTYRVVERDRGWRQWACKPR